jgi:Na+:H+ antiporter, NhaC family
MRLLKTSTLQTLNRQFMSPSFFDSSLKSSLDAIAVLFISVALLVTSAFTGTFIAYPLLLSLVLFVGVLVRRGFALLSLIKMGYAGARQALPVVNVLLLIGIITAVWMASGTVPALVYYGTGLISPRFFILWAFVLMGLVSTLLGTSFGAVGTLGVALMVMARSGDGAVNPVAGAIIAGAFVGDRCSAMSSSAHLVAAVTHTSLYDNLRNMILSSRWPLFLSLIFYTGLSFLYPVKLIANPVTAALPTVFDLSPIVLLPAGAIIALALLRVPVKLAMGVSIGIGVAIAHFVQHYPLLTLIQFSLVGYQPGESTASAALQTILLGGGLLPMAKATLVVFISTAFAGIFAGSRTLSFVDSWLKHIRTRRQLGCATVLVSLLANVFGCTQTIAILLTGQIMRPHYQAYCNIYSQDYSQDRAAAEQADQQLAIALEDTAVVIAPCIPWNIAGLIPATILMVGPGFIPYMAYLLLLPIFVTFTFEDNPSKINPSKGRSQML